MKGLCCPSLAVSTPTHQSIIISIQRSTNGVKICMAISISLKNCAIEYWFYTNLDVHRELHILQRLIFKHSIGHRGRNVGRNKLNQLDKKYRKTKQVSQCRKTSVSAKQFLNPLKSRTRHGWNWLQLATWLYQLIYWIRACTLGSLCAKPFVILMT